MHPNPLTLYGLAIAVFFAGYLAPPGALRDASQMMAIFLCGMGVGVHQP